ncbi:hypothetical protein JW756_06020 [Candidatus Woesearchaeota archaeon]|nr:hypothetical protein [Candidatus Woesearchaeota archaeon]
MTFVKFERPSFFGKRRDEFFRAYDAKYGQGNWRISWEWAGETILFPQMCLIYEDGYYHDSFNREALWKELVSVGKNVYDHDEKDIESGLDYSVQKGIATHLQDIAIRRVVFRRGWKFHGDKLVQIRSHADYWGAQLSPGRVPFHMPENIIAPHLEGWWDYNSIEDAYQSDKILEVKKEVLVNILEKLGRFPKERMKWK